MPFEFADGSNFELADGSVFELEDGSFTREDQIRYIERRIAGYMEGTEHRKRQAVKLQREVHVEGDSSVNQRTRFNIGLCGL